MALAHGEPLQEQGSGGIRIPWEGPHTWAGAESDPEGAVEMKH